MKWVLFIFAIFKLTDRGLAHDINREIHQFLKDRNEKFILQGCSYNGKTSSNQ